ncbi:alpha-hydroxy-acid oxidizing protein [Solirubrobacter taibaiensis]|nr:alpha-hydroxy-acid oxidizing protein [Solirubrobacter taibaiensis]
MPAFATADEVTEAARSALPTELWDYVSGGGGTEITLRRNRSALDSVCFRPRVARDVSDTRADTTVLGIECSAPVLLAPIGTIGLFDAGGAATCARAAARAGTAAFVSILSTPSLEEVAATGAPLIYQHYTRGSRAWTLDLFRRAEASGYRAICVTVDSPVDGLRERELRHRFDRGKAQAQPNLGRDARRELQAELTWSEIAWLAEQTELPLLLKGVTHPEDAVLALEAGVAALIVSNHGGRQLDAQLGAVEVLPGVVEAVGGRAEVLVDGGFERGGDVVKALALGARAVLIGRAMCLSLAAGGEDTLVETLARLQEEVSRTLALLGVSTPGAVSREYLVGG